MSTSPQQNSPVKRRKPELISVRVIPWNERIGLYGLFYEFDDGENFGEVWGSREATELAAFIRAKDIRPMPAGPAVR
jgi:hypothetical protein